MSRRFEGLLVHFDASSDQLTNPSLISLLQRLAAERVAFALDYKQIMSPGDHVSLLMEKGIKFNASMGCGFDGERWWIVDLPMSGPR